MKNGYLVREFAKLTRVTVRTLHYYDQIGLLRPSFERPNGYRVYTDADLLRLQQIVTLKFMGFSLNQILELLETKGRINQKKLIKIMEVIQMGEDVKKTWHEKFFTEAELKEFREVGKKYTPEMEAAYRRSWAELIEEVKKNLKADPASETAQSLAKKWTDLLNEAYGSHPELKARIGEAYASGAVPDGYRMFGPEVLDFIKKAHAAAKKK